MFFIPTNFLNLVSHINLIIMPQVKSKSEVEEILSSRERNRKPIIFGDEIAKLKKGEALHITPKEWKLKTVPPSYYYPKYNKDKEKKVISISKLKDGGYLIKKV
jgi:hypothetical protein